MISKAQIKYIQSLRKTKFRARYGAFVVEGEKMVLELLKSDFEMELIFALPDWIKTHADKLKSYKVFDIAEKELKSISEFVTPQPVLAVSRIPTQSGFDEPEEWVIVLDGIRDPGNLGTIFRTADWFGFSEIVCSPDCVDQWNSKVVQASMGSIFRINVSVQNLDDILERQGELPCFAATMEGDDSMKTKWPRKGTLVFGSESHGVSRAILSKADCKQITIPRFGKAESLNVSTACAILLADIRRK